MGTGGTFIACISGIFVTLEAPSAIGSIVCALPSLVSAGLTDIFFTFTFTGIFTRRSSFVVSVDAFVHVRSAVLSFELASPLWTLAGPLCVLFICAKGLTKN